MYELRFSILWIGAGVTIILAIIYLSLASGASPVMPVSVNDKIGHLTAYAVLMVWFGGVFKRRAQWFFVVTFFALGVGLEFLQGWGGIRAFEAADMAMNGLGVVVGKKLCRVGLSGWCQRVERLAGKWFSF